MMEILEEQKRIIDIISKGLSARYKGIRVVADQTQAGPMREVAVYISYPLDHLSDFTDSRHYYVRTNIIDRDATDALLLEVERIVMANESTIRSFGNYDKVKVKVMPRRSTITLEREPPFFKRARMSKQ